MKNKVIAKPIRIRARCFFSQSCVGTAGPVPPARTSALEEKLHLDAGDFDQVMVLERMRRAADWLTVDRRALGALDVRNEVTLRTARQHRDLHAGLAERGQRLCELEFLAGIAARQQLDCAERLLGGCRCSSGGC